MHWHDDWLHPEYCAHIEATFWYDVEDPQGQEAQPPGQFPPSKIIVMIIVVIIIIVLVLIVIIKVKL